MMNPHGNMGRPTLVKTLHTDHIQIKNTPMLYPSESAPKDRVILGEFGFHGLHPVIWNPVHQQWCFAMLEIDVYEGELQDTSFVNEYAEPSELRGWMPIPFIFKETSPASREVSEKRKKKRAINT